MAPAPTSNCSSLWNARGGPAKVKCSRPQGWGNLRQRADKSFMSEPANATDRLSLLLTCVGRRIELIQAFRRAADRLGITLELIGADRTPTAPALHCVDVPLIVPDVTDAGYVPTLLEAVRRHGVRALVPTIDTDLPVLAEHRDAFEAAGCVPLIATPDVIGICRDKIETYHFLRRHGIDTPQTWLPQELLAGTERRFPYFVKPRFGSASRWVHVIEDELDLDYYLQKVRDAIVQEFVPGLEHTLDVYVGLTGRPRCVVPRARWQVRAGEVAKGVVVKDAQVMEAGRRVVEALGPTVRGVVTLQCIVTSERRIRFIEINPRFGGGAPLGIAAGADYPRWLLEELLGRTPRIRFDGFTHGLCMLRYDWSVFVELPENLDPRHGRAHRVFPPFRSPPAESP